MTRNVYARVQTAADQVDLAGLAPTMRGFMTANVASAALVFLDPHVPARTSRPGCVIASPSWTGVTDQNYFHHWVRDAAITAFELAAAPDLDGNGVDRALCDYVAFSKLCQDNAPADHFFRAAFHIDGTARDWSDQKDGPSLQGLAFAAAWPYLDAPARAALRTHWRDDVGCYLSVPGGQPGSPTTDTSAYDPNADVIMGCVYGSVPCTDPRLLATAARLRAAYDVGGSHEYPINVDDRARGLGPLIGRYPSDNYDGDIEEKPNHGHPWAICTANLAELHYLLAGAFRAGDGPAFDDLTGSFFTQAGLDEATVTAGGQAVVDALVDAGDRMLRAVVFHSDHQHLSEQFDKVTGFEKSVQDLTWSYAAYLSAVRARQ